MLVRSERKCERPGDREIEFPSCCSDPLSTARSRSNNCACVLVSRVMRERIWRIGERVFDLSRHGLIMGVLNVTPDSFSDGGEFFTSRKSNRARPG